MKSPEVACEVAQVRIPALDGYELGGLLCSARGEKPARVAVLHPGAGIRAVTEITDLKGIADYRRTLQDIDGGPRLARIRIATGHVDRALPPRDGVYLKNRFRENLGFPVS